MILSDNNPGQVRRGRLDQERKQSYVTSDKILMVAAEIKAVSQDSNVETRINVCQRRVFTKAMSFICRYLWQGRR